jgi:hypothetical protein
MEISYISTKSTKFKMSDQNQYTEDNIRSLDWKSTSVCVLVCILGNWRWFFSWWRYLYPSKRGAGQLYRWIRYGCQTIEVTIKDKTVTVRDYGRGFLLESDWVVSKMNTGEIRFLSLRNLLVWTERNKSSKCFIQLLSRRIVVMRNKGSWIFKGI